MVWLLALCIRILPMSFLLNEDWVWLRKIEDVGNNSYYFLGVGRL